MSPGSGPELSCPGQLFLAEQPFCPYIFSVGFTSVFRFENVVPGFTGSK
jgi:hypothetical protein